MIKIKRGYHEDCLLGVLEETETGFKCFTLELEYNNNLPNISSIPQGTYEAYKHNSQKNGPCIALKNVPGRAHIQIHKGNFTTQIKGCILVGDSIKFLDGDRTPDVTNSTKTLTKLLNLLDDEFEVQIL